MTRKRLAIGAALALIALAAFLMLRRPAFLRSEVAQASGEALLDAVELGETQRVKDLLETGADPNFRDAQGRTPLKLAPSPEMARLLREHGARPSG